MTGEDVEKKIYSVILSKILTKKYPISLKEWDTIFSHDYYKDIEIRDKIDEIWYYDHNIRNR